MLTAGALSVCLVASLTGPLNAAPKRAATLALHVLDIEGGAASIAIAPDGTAIGFDTANAGEACTALLAAYTRLGVQRLDTLVISHYAERTIGCVPELLDAIEIGRILDRGGTQKGAFFKAYRQAAKKKRKRVRAGQSIVLERATRAGDDTVLDVLAANGKTIGGDTRVPRADEHDRGLVVRLRAGAFDALLGGAVSGQVGDGLHDIEGLLAPAVGLAEVYRVHADGSARSSSAAWLSATQPRAALLDVDRSPRGSPDVAALRRLRQVVERTFWTDRGRGARPKNQFDSVCGDITVTFELAATIFQVLCAGRTRAFDLHAVPAEGAPGVPRSLNAAVDGATVTLNWQAPTARASVPGEVEDYLVEIGDAPGASNVVQASTTARTFAHSITKGGTYYARVRGRNDAGDGSPTGDVAFVIDASVPNRPGNLTASVNGTSVTLNWSAPATAASAKAGLSYRVEIGSSAGSSDVAVATTAGTSHTRGGLGVGTYHARVRAMNDFGNGPRTDDVTFEITQVDDDPVSPTSLTMILFLVEDTVIITNEGDTDQPMGSWMLVSTVGGESFTFPADYVLPNGAAVAVIAGGRALPNPPFVLEGWTEAVWDDNGDTAQLFDDTGQLILEVAGVPFRIGGP